MPFSAYYLTPEGEIRRNLTGQEIADAFLSKQGVLWVDVFETTEEDGNFLERTFSFHPLTIEDCVSTLVHSPKVDEYNDYLFIIVHGINYAVEGDIVETTELALFLGSHFVVSNHKVPLYSVEAVRRAVEEGGRPMLRGAAFLAHALIDALVDNVLPTIDRMYEVAEEIEDEAISSPQTNILDGIRKLKRSTLRLHRVMVPQREVLNRIGRGDFALITREARDYFRNVYEQIIRIEDLNQTLRERADNALTIYLSSVANRQNETMKLLSIVASIFLPLTLITGIYGMNFENMPELRWTWGYFAVLGLMGTVAAGALWWFWARRWLVWRRPTAWVRPFTVETEKLISHLGRWTHLKP